MPASCSKCHKQTEIDIRQSINVALDPELKARVKDGSLFLWECPYCGARNLAKYQTLYHDPDSKLMVWLLPGEEQPPQAVEEAVKELEGYTLRRVKDVGELIEKVNIHDAGLEDTVLEMCKWVTRRELAAKNPASVTAALKFLRMEGADNELVMAFPLDGQMQVVNVGFNVYEDARGILLRNPAVRPAPGFAEVNAAWIDQFFR
ncbi:MAG: CpXC domain-containing protein [Candidatus Cryptobacteroides sp.]|nr:CpXC domain-containing protein [Candidatus Cryptobacteroides sp.]